MKKLFILLITVVVFINSVSFFASAFDNSEYEKQWIEELRYITENGAAKDPEFEFFGEGDGGKILPLEQVEYFRQKKNAVLSFKYEYDESVSESVKKSFGDVINIEFYYSYNSYMTYKLHTKEKDVITVAEIEESLKMKKPEGIVGIIIKNINPYVNITEYTFTTEEGWLTPDDKTYYVTKSGTLQTKSCSIDGIRYSFSSDGVCKGRYTGWTKSSKGRRYYKNGELVKNKWLKTKSGKRYYADKKGYVVTGENIIKDKAYLFSDKGVLKGGPFELCTVTVTDTETGKVYISHTNGETWLNDEKAPVYAAAVNGRVPVSAESIAFIIYNESGRSLSHFENSFDTIRMKYMLDGAILGEVLTAYIHEPDTIYRDEYGLKFYEGIKAGKCVYTKIVGNFEIKVEFMFVQG